MTIPSDTSPTTVPVISARDPDVLALFPGGFGDRYEVLSYRNAASILATTCKAEFEEIIDRLMAFEIQTVDMVASGGNKSKIAIRMEDLLKPLGWDETRITGDLLITRTTRYREARTVKAGKNKGSVTYDPKVREEKYQIPGFVDGHKVDFVKGRVAFDMEWNSKDQTFDRDLYAVRAMYECNLVTVGVLLTRSAALAPLFGEIQNRLDIDGFKSKYGASTTWMDKLTYRLNAGRAGGCPILAIGIKPGCVPDFEQWKAAHPVKRRAKFDIAEDVEEEAEEG